MFSRLPANGSSKLHLFVSFDVWVRPMFSFVLKALFTKLCNCACSKKDCYAYQNMSYLCCIKTQENWLITWNKRRNQFRIYQICKKKCKCLSLTKTNRKYYYFIFTFYHFILPIIWHTVGRGGSSPACLTNFKYGILIVAWYPCSLLSFIYHAFWKQ